MISSSWTCHAAVALAALLPMAHGAFVVFEGSSTTVPGFTNDMNIADVGTVIGDGNTLNTGRGSDSIVIQGNGNMINDGNDASTITILGNGNDLNADRGNDKIIVIGDGNTVRGDRGGDLLHVLGNMNTVSGGRDTDQIVVTGNNNEIGAGRQDDSLVVVRGNDNLIRGREGDDRLTFAGNDNTVRGEEETDTFVPAYKNFDSSSMDSATITDYESNEPIDFTDFTCAGMNMYNLGLRANSDDSNNLDLVVYADGMTANDGGDCFNKVIITLNGVTLTDVMSGFIVNIVNPGCLNEVAMPTFPVCM